MVKKKVAVKKSAPKKSVAKKSVQKKTVKKSGFISKNIVAIGTGVAALGAATYYLFGPKGEQHQKQLKGWMHSMKTEVDKRMKKAENMTQNAYHAVVDEVAKSYAKNGKAKLADIAGYAKSLKKQWKSGVKKTASRKSSVKKVSKKK